jgi:ubiquinone biosynthesis protein
LRTVASQSRHVEQAKRLRLLFDELGGFWVKLGQLMSLRTDLFPDEMCRELEKLQDTANGFSFDVARAIVEAELERPISTVFDVFEEAPFAAASIGQIHRAHLARENTWVAVKVQRPFIAEIFAKDLALVRRVTSLLEVLRIWPHVRWRDFHWELEHILREEVDYRFESSNIDRMRKTLRRHRVYVPKVYYRYSSRRLLVMEFVEGALMSDYLRLIKSDPPRLFHWLAENNIDPVLLARRLCHSILRQILEDNLYHADWHPGNIILLRDSRFALIDFGSVGFLERAYLEKFHLLMQACGILDYDKAVDLLFLLSEGLPLRDLERLKEELVRALRAWGARTFVKQLPYSQKSQDNVWREIGSIYMHHKCTIPWSILRVQRAFTTLDASLMHLDPKLNYTATNRHYFRQAQARALQSLGTPESMRETVTNLAIASRLPERIAELAFYYTSIARKHAKVFEGATSKVASMFAVLFGNLTLLCVLAALAILLVLLNRYAPNLVAPLMRGVIGRVVHAIPAFETDTGFLLLAVNCYLGWTFARLRRRFGRHEVGRSGGDRPGA